MSSPLCVSVEYVDQYLPEARGFFALTKGLRRDDDPLAVPAIEYGPSGQAQDQLRE